MHKTTRKTVERLQLRLLNPPIISVLDRFFVWELFRDKLHIYLHIIKSQKTYFSWEGGSRNKIGIIPTTYDVRPLTKPEDRHALPCVIRKVKKECHMARISHGKMAMQ